MSSPPLHPEVLATVPPLGLGDTLQQRKIQDLLGSLGFALRSFNNLNLVLKLVPLMASRVTETEAGVIMLLQEDRLRLKELYCPPSEALALQELQKTFILLRNTALPSGNSALDAWLKEHLRPDIQLFSAPIFVKRTVRGYLWVLSQRPDYRWDEDRATLLRLVADQTAVAIAHEELSTELRRRDKLSQEIDIGSEIQERLLPKVCPEIPGLAVAARCENAASSKVGGDYYDFIPMPDAQRWGLVLGDVMGKGVPAGLLMMMTRGTLRSEVFRQESPDQILNHLNRVMYPDLENSNRFVTLFYAEYEPATRRLCFSNAAHPRPYYWQQATGTFRALEAAGTLIGLNLDTTYPEETIYLAPGDVLVCYTDGFTEALSQRDGRYGEENWAKQVRWAATHCETPEQILTHLYQEIHRFCGGNSSDDMTMMVLKAVP